jgi:hypothetical protein
MSLDFKKESCLVKYEEEVVEELKEPEKEEEEEDTVR